MFKSSQVIKFIKSAMQYIVIAHDYKDGLERKLASREEHIKLGST